MNLSSQLSREKLRKPPQSGNVYVPTCCQLFCTVSTPRPFLASSDTELAGKWSITCDRCRCFKTCPMTSCVSCLCTLFATSSVLAKSLSIAMNLSTRCTSSSAVLARYVYMTTTYGTVSTDYQHDQLSLTNISVYTYM